MVSRPVALVTGAGRGIGAATVRRLAADGWAVVAVDACADDPALPYPLATRAELDAVVAEAAAHARSRDGAAVRLPADAVAARPVGGAVPDPSASRPGAAGDVVAAVADASASRPGAAGAAGDVVAAVADVRDEAALERAVALAVERFGGLDAAVAVAGAIGGGVPLWEMPAARVAAMVEINLGGVIALARAAIPALLERPEPRAGRFLAVASAAASRGMPGLAAYSAAKAGVTGLVRGLAADLRGSGVTANAVSPGSTATPILDESARLYDLPDAAAFAPQHTLERLLAPDEIAGTIAWLCGPEASALTGATIAADGGLTL